MSVKAARLAALCLLGCIEFAACAQAAGQQEYRWFQDAKFGMFIHWGPYSVASVEASWPIMVPDSSLSYDDYIALPSRFNPVKFDAKAWVRLAKAAGQKYIVFTTKHHDGFAMFDATNTDYKITKTPFDRDVFAELARAAREEGMPLGIYYSPPDMHHPGYRDMTRPAHEHPWRGGDGRAAPAGGGALHRTQSGRRGAGEPCRGLAMVERPRSSGGRG